jgi:nitrite reductase/ring-hydroxylating ferredoxin subunit
VSVTDATVDACVGRLDDLPPGTMRRVEVAGRALCLGNDDGTLFALDDACLHKGGSLAAGMLRDGCVTCPMHWWRYDVRTGRLVAHEAATATYRVRVDAAGRVVVSVPPAPPRRSWRETLLAHAREARREPR